MFEYPVHIEKDDNGTWRVECPDIPELHSFGETREEAFDNACEALEAALSFYIDEGRALPKASTTRRRICAQPSLQGMMKLAIYKAMRDKKIRRIDMARLLKVAPPQVDRLVDLTHASRMEQLENALKALGKRAQFALEDA